MGRLFILGDSLADGGAYSDVVFDNGGGLAPQINYRFTNNRIDGSALTYAEQFGVLNGVSTTPNVINDGPDSDGIGGLVAGGTNFAQGGSRVADPAGTGNPTGMDDFITTIPVVSQTPGADSQIARLLDYVGGSFKDNDVITISAGANDLFVATGAAELVDAATQLAEGVSQLEAAGAKNIIVLAVPDIGFTPLAQALEAAGAGSPAELSGATASFNSFLKLRLKSTNAVVFDPSRFFAAAVANPGRYGLGTGLSATQDDNGLYDETACSGVLPLTPGGPPLGDSESSLNCLEGFNPAAPPGDAPFLFADSVHPTAEAHLLLAQAMQGMLNGAVDQARLLESLQQTQRVADLWRDDRLRPTAFYYLSQNDGWVRREAGDMRVHFIGQYSSVETDSDPVFGAADSDALKGTIALDSLFGERTLVGGELRFSGGEIDLSSSEASWTSYGVGLYAMTMLHEEFYLRGAAGFEFINFDEIDRTVTLGPSTETYAGETEALRHYLNVGVGGAFPVGPGSLLTPEASYALEYLRVEAYEEELGAASIAYGENDIESHRLIGALTLDTAPPSLPGWSFTLRGAYEHELNDERHDIEVGSDPDGIGTLSFERFDGSFGSLSGKVGRVVGAGVLSVGGGATLPAEGETGFTGTVSFEMGL